jgi:hypothetical protein
VKRAIRLARQIAALTACIAVAWFWIGSYQIEEWLCYSTGQRTGLRSVGVASCRGTIALSMSRWTPAASSRSVEVEDRGWIHRRMDTQDGVIEPVPPDATLSAGFGWMASAPQENDMASVTWRFLILPWWGVAAAGVMATMAVAGVKACCRRKRGRPRQQPAAAVARSRPGGGTDSLSEPAWQWPLPPHVSS